MIFFNVLEARSQLVGKGVVYTLRRSYTRTGRTYAVEGPMSTNRLLCEVVVEHVCEIKQLSDLEPYLSESGFSDIGVWLSKAAPSARTLYKVVKIA